MYYEAGPMELWQWLYLLLMASTIPPLIAAIVMDLHRGGTPAHQTMPTWLYITGGLGLLMLITPHGWLVLWAILVAFWGQAPLAPMLFGTVFVIGAWILAFTGVLDLPRLWRTISPRM